MNWEIDGAMELGDGRSDGEYRQDSDAAPMHTFQWPYPD